jgi:hypothetical protein
MGNSGLLGLTIRAVLGIGFLALAWIAGGEAVTMGVLGAESTGRVDGYWMREPLIPTGRSGGTKQIREPRVTLEGGRALNSCRVVYRGFRHDRELPGRGERIQVLFRPDTHGDCIARSTAYSPMRLGLAGGFLVVGGVICLSFVSEFAM